MSTTKEFAELYLQDILARLKMYKSLADDAVAQLDDEHLFAALDEESNSMAVLLKHMAGNMRSRWTNFLTSDGEKPWRQRDAEFMIEEADAKTALLDHWEESWQLVFETVKSLDADDLKRTVTVRGESHTVMEAINRQLTHYAYHVGQIVVLAKHFAAEHWETLSVPRGASEAFNQAMRDEHNP
jgi:uncharacterized damage-inducible protein DinB